MCRVEECVYIGADGQRQTFEDSYPCYKSKYGKLCSNVKRKTTEYCPKLKPIIQDSRDSTIPPAPDNSPTSDSTGSYLVQQHRPSIIGRHLSTRDGSRVVMPEIIIEFGPKKYKDRSKNYNLSSLGAASTNENDFAIESPGSDESFTVRTEPAEISVRRTNPYRMPWDADAKSSMYDDEKFSRYDDTKTTITSGSSSTYYSAVSRTGSMRHIQSNRLRQDNEYYKLLQSKDLWPVDPMIEKNWSSRGQHAEFQKSEKKLLDEMLPVQDDLGSTSTAIVQSVKCKRILLARKTIRCNRNFTKEKAIEEVVHLSKLDHSHVVQIIGTYVVGHDISILMYPVAGYNLETFIEDLDPESHHEHIWDQRIASLKTFVGCLTRAVEYIHSKLTKHMDIKPRNILVRDLRHIPSVCREETFKVYITDFGISRSYDTLDATETEGPAMFTRRYAAPEVVDRSKRGLSADIFSLGCVFVEIGTTLSSFPIDSTSTVSHYQMAKVALDGDYRPLRGLEGVLYENEYGDTSYQANINAVCEFIRKSWLPLGEGNITKITEAQILAMLSKDPLNRPTIDTLASSITPPRQCCTAGAEIMEVAPSELAEEEETE